MGRLSYHAKRGKFVRTGRERPGGRVCPSSTFTFPSVINAVISRLHRSQHTFREALCDSFNTPLALQILLDLVSMTNKYLKRGRSATNIGVVRHVASWTTKMVRMFGLSEGPPAEIGWGTQMHGTVEGAVDVSSLSGRYCGANFLGCRGTRFFCRICEYYPPLGMKCAQKPSKRRR
jgi:hypothetical protein